MKQNLKLIKTIKRVLCLVLGFESSLVSCHIDRGEELFQLWRNAEGLTQALKRAKAVKAICVSVSLRNEVYKQNDGVSCHPDGIPKCVGFLRPYLFGSSSQRRYAFTVLSTYLLFVDKPSLDVSTIVDAGKGSYEFTFDELSLAFRRFSREWKLTKPFKPKFSWYGSSKAGPNGKPAWKYGLHDLAAVKADRYLYPIITEIASHFRGKAINFGLSPGLRGRFILNRSKDKTKSGHHSKIHFLSEGGGKTRVIAIGDLFSQTLLKPIHDHLMSLLRLIPMDGTYDQLSQIRRVKDASKSGKVFCYDLTACTDRFPVLFQRQVLSLIFGEGLAWKGQQLLTGRSFSNPRLDTKVSYSVGQPMGLLSSWAAMAFSHHMVVQVCSIRAIGSITDRYALLGDDIVIGDSLVAEEYAKFMVQVLGVDISLNKSIVSTMGAEFAKTLFGKGENVSPIPLKLCVAVSFYPNLLPMFVKDLFRYTGDSLNIFQLIKLVPKNKFNQVITLLTCPLYSNSSVWGVPDHNVGSYLKSLRYSEISFKDIVDQSQRDFDKILDSYGFPIKGPSLGYTNPWSERLSSISHPMTIERSFLDVQAGDGFIMINPGSEFEETFRFSTFEQRYSHHSKRVEKYLILSRYLLQAAKFFDVQFTPYTIFVDPDLAKLKPKV